MSEALSYPMEPPVVGDWVEVEPGVRWIRLPLALPLGHVNVWALDDGDGWTLIDTGSGTAETRESWERLLAAGPLARPLKRLIVTHMHPDHVGLAGWFAARFEVTLSMSRLEYLSCRVARSDTGREPPPDALRFYQAAGWDQAALEAYRTRFGSFGRNIAALPDSYLRLTDGDVVRIGEHDWQVVTGCGHSPEHTCLYDRKRKLLISGDQVLPKISSNISVHPLEPEADPMSDWLASLEKLRRTVLDDVLVLPSHNACFRGLHARLVELEAEQRAALDRLLGGLAEPRRVVDVFPYLFRRQIDCTNAPLLGMATGESVACLNYLMRKGQVKRQFKDRVAWYSCS